MKKACTLFISFLFLQYSKGQSFIQLNTGKLYLPAVATINVDSFWSQQAAIDGQYFALIQLAQTVSQPSKQQLRASGVFLNSYISPNAYLVSFNNKMGKQALLQLGISHLSFLPASFKISPTLQHPEKYNWLSAANGSVEVLVKIAPTISAAAAAQWLATNGFATQASGLEAYFILKTTIHFSKINALAAVAFVEWVEPAQKPSKILNNRSQNIATANIAAAPLAFGGDHLTGQGVVIGVGDDGNSSSHIDLKDRIIERSGFVYNHHATHVSGTVGGAGISRFYSRGFAPSATIISQFFGGIYTNAGKYVNDYGMVLTNNSYGNVVHDSLYEGVYDLYSRVLDEQAFLYPELLHVFASGNDGDEVVVPPYPFHYGTVLSSYQSAKNVITVGRVDDVLYASESSSSGPVRDGRLKPEMTALGEFVISTSSSNNNYLPEWGTSQSAPAVTGGLALMVEQYKKQFSNNPKSGLLKAIALNGGRDLGKQGPDFRHGYGLLDINRSLDIIKNNHFYANTIAQNATQTQAIVVPPNTAQLKVMLYWHDPAAAIFSPKTLVNDLDVEVISPTASQTLPQKLDTIPANVANAATTGADHINNSEQVLINNPTTGTYTIKVKGTAINQNVAQDYFVAYDFLPQGLQLTNPYNGSSFAPGETLCIQWTDNGTPNNQRTLEYSLNDGANWTVIANNIVDTARFYNWIVPPAATTTAKIRITENATPFTHTTGRFVLLGVVNHSFAPAAEQCEGYCKIVWPPVAGATAYEVLMKQGADMQTIATTAQLNFVVSGLNKDSVYWFCVKPMLNGVAGKRSDGQPYQPAGGACSLGISDADLKLDAILLPNTGRKLAASALTATTNLAIRIKNVDDAPINNFTVKYSINGGPFVPQSVATTIAPGGTYTHTFTGINLSAEGLYTIVAVVKNATPDAVTKNDTLIKVIKQLSNAPISLASPFLENFEAALPTENVANVVGIDGLDRWDFTSTTPIGRARTFVNTGVAYSGSKAITIDVKEYAPTGSSNFLTGTFNLATYNALTDNIRFDVQFKQHGSFQNSNTDNRIWVRGNENNTWILVYNLETNQPETPGQWKRTVSINLAKALSDNGQNFSTTTQMRFGQNSILGMGDDAHFGGYSFDDVRIYTVANDASITSITSPATNNCAASNNTAVSIILKNTVNNPLANLAVSYSINGSGVVTEIIPMLNAGQSLPYTFNTPANIAATGSHTIKVWSSYATDNFKDNDTLSTLVYNQPIVTSFPYLQDFENNNGQFYTNGKNTSWEYGVANGNRIKGAASGTKVWKTTLQGFYNDEELSYLYTPCFNTTALPNPTLSFSMAYDIEFCRPDACDGAWVEYSVDGNTWFKLGSITTGTNWYNNASNQTWDSTKAHWHVATTSLPSAANLRLRFVLATDLFTGKEGVAIDDIHVYNKQFDIYEGLQNSNTITQNVAGSSPIHFTDAGKLIATIFANGNNLGSTAAKAYLWQGPLRNDTRQYYSNRNITLQPTNLSTTTPVTIRYYFTDKDADALRLSKSCNGCTNPLDYTRIGILKYDDANDANENGTMADNTNGLYSLFNSSVVPKVPYGSGYYAEFNVSSFSEFWLNDGTPLNVILPAQWLSFTAQKINKEDALLQWQTTTESNVLQYEVELSKANLSANGFMKIANVAAKNLAGINTYQSTDAAVDKHGLYYYRIKRIDRNGQVAYSETRVIIFGEKGSNIVVYPNPVKDKVQVLLQAAVNQKIQWQLYDALGKILLSGSTVATGALQKELLNMATYPNGMYQLKLLIANQPTFVKLVKQ